MPVVKEIMWEAVMSDLVKQQGAASNLTVPTAVILDGVSYVNTKQTSWSLLKNYLRKYDGSDTDGLIRSSSTCKDHP